MTNPFEVIENRLTSIENLLLDLKQKPIDVGKQNEAEKLLTIQEAAEFLSLTVPTIYSKVSKNQLPFMKRGKRLYFSSVQLIEYIKDGRKKSNAEIEAEAEAYLSNNKKRLNYGK
jgi:excisionase family DNA binding protein